MTKVWARLSLLTIFTIQASLSIASEHEHQPESPSADPHPIQETVEPDPIPSAMIEAPPALNIVVEQPAETFWWKLVDPIIAAIGILLAAWLIVWQMGRQHRDSLRLQKENFRTKLCTNIYSELQMQISIASSAEIAASSYARAIPLSLINYRGEVRKGYVNAANCPIVRERAVEFAKLNNEMSHGAIGLISIFENYSISVPEFDVFKYALNSALYDVREAFSALHNVLLVRLPMDMREHLPIEMQNVPNADYVPPPPNNEELDEVQKVVGAYISATDDVGSYIYDLVVESQNTLLSDLYPGRKASIREPIDPRLKVITSTNAVELRQYFREKTPWGRSCQEAEDRVLEQLAAREQGQ